MALIKPFKALRFTDKAGDISALCCPPYDIISDDERRAYLSENEFNIIRLELPREGEDPYAEAAGVLRGWLKDGVLATDEQPAYYIYGEQFTAHDKQYAFKGIIARVHIEEFERGIVLPHEETLSKAKVDRFNLMDATMCNFSQIYSLYKDDGGVTDALIDRLSAGEPEHCFTDAEGVTHRLWVVTDPAAIEAFGRQFSDRKLYIADGHHRYETALNFRNSLRERGLAAEGDECDYCMMMLVSLENKGLVVFPTHRIVRGLQGFDAAALIDGCSDKFDCEQYDDLSLIDEKLQQCYDAGQKAFALYCGSGWTLMKLRDISVMADAIRGSKALRELDVSVLHSLILEQQLGIDKQNMANQLNLTYTRDKAEALAAVDSGAANCCFIINPTRVDEISAVATAGEKMPQKSTYFYPKLITGLVMNKFGEVK